MKKIIYELLKFINKIVPKSSHIFLFHSFPDASDNTLALFEYIVKNKRAFLNNNEIIWLLSKDVPFLKKNIEERVGTEIKSIKFYKRISIKGLFAFFRSKVIISTHGCFSSISCDKQINFNLWHGMPFKKIGFLLDNCNSDKILKADVTIATTKVFQKIMARCFNITEEYVYETGCPRNDYFFSKFDFLQKLGINKNEYIKVLFWLPTYRKSVIGDIRTDGNEKSFGITEVFEKYYNELELLLKEKRYLLIIKPHPMDIIDKYDFPSSQNIKFIHNDELLKHNVQLYELLSNSDSLITDYSSVFIDYLSTKKPIAFTVGDIEDYSTNRGFIFNPPLDYLPGEIIRNVDQFIEYIKFYDEKNLKWRSKYDAICTKFNSCTEPVSSEHVYNKLIEIIRKE